MAYLMRFVSIFATDSWSARCHRNRRPIPLRQAADQAHVLVGTAVRPCLFSEAAYSATLAREFNMVEAEDAMKWWVVRRTPEIFDFQRQMKSCASRSSRHESSRTLPGLGSQQSRVADSRQFHACSYVAHCCKSTSRR